MPSTSPRRRISIREHFEAAVKARKHIFMEKPAGVDPAGCQRVVEAAKKADTTKRITVDYQQRYGKDYRNAYEIVKSGELGGIKHGARRLARRRPAGARPAIRRAKRRCATGSSIARHSGDIIVEQNCHNIDVVNWFMGTHPVKAFGYGGRAGAQGYRQHPGQSRGHFHFEDGTVFSYSANQFSAGGFQDVSETFICEKGTVNTSRAGL